MLEKTSGAKDNWRRRRRAADQMLAMDGQAYSTVLDLIGKTPSIGPRSSP